MGWRRTAVLNMLSMYSKSPGSRVLRKLEFIILFNGTFCPFVIRSRCHCAAGNPTQTKSQVKRRRVSMAIETQGNSALGYSEAQTGGDLFIAKLDG